MRGGGLDGYFGEQGLAVGTVRDMPKPFYELQGQLLHLFQCLGFAALDGMGCLNRIFKKWADERFLQGGKNIGAKGLEGSFQVKQHPTGFIGSTDDIIFSYEPGV